MGETYYEILDISPDATQAEITAAYRERVLETHPDRNDDPDAADQFTRVTTAEEVLSDEKTRARYDRLGHDAYVRMTDRFSGGEPDTSRSDSGSNSTSASGQTTSASASETAGDSSAEDYRSRSRGYAGKSGTDDRSGRGPSHHARQRARRERAWNERGGPRRDWGDSDEDRDRTDGSGATATEGTGADARSGRRTRGADSNGGAGVGVGVGTATKTETTTDDSSDGFRYTVHDWDDDVDLEEPRQRLDRETFVTVCAITLLYPMLVYASVTPQFSLLVNGVVAACTLLLVGYLLTIPRVAIVSFGLWSVLVPVGLPRFAAIEPLSLVGLLVTGAFWVPFGYAVAVRWALRP